MENNSGAVSRPSFRRPAAVRIRTMAAGSFLAAASAAGLGVIGAAPARAALVPPPVLSALECAAQAEGTECGSQERLAGIRADLGNAVAWGSVTQAQADRFYAQLEDRISRGL
ncbi:hypothetical protein [Arthrobacter sp. zg-Y1171]|uniref:hypothetical protein n=1 Tax=Arthrobacter sp. zg-Y1171 TaxID=2964610 RepID=UPI002103F668|nr:hypothetical protein [Arthrobacter sp. zg-Y1171]MCQ1994667.1 hypothetical protein [Arthrobacter sp. zg-Y1171]UWX81256.1 hypothetical protein N2L00_12760 [Arthrobacter sp. zg-Y1171]